MHPDYHACTAIVIISITTNRGNLLRAGAERFQHEFAGQFSFGIQDFCNVFGMLGETIELTVRATDRDCYALGALQAARFVTTQPAGLYTMDDLLGL